MNNDQIQRLALIAGGSLLVIYGLRRRSPGALAAALVGAAAAAAGIASRRAEAVPPDASIPHERGITIEKSVTINQPIEELYRFWRNFENLPKIMSTLDSVTVRDSNKSHWVAKTVGGKRVEWDVEIVHEEENALIAWRTVEDAEVRHAGSVHFGAKPHGRGTAVRVIIRYDPPGGRFGAAIARLGGEDPAKQLSGDLRRFKQIMEIGEIPRIEGQPSGATAPVKTRLVEFVRGAAEATT